MMKNIKEYKLLIFDWDGTLMNSIDRIVTSVQFSAETIGLTAPDSSSIKALIGLSLPKVFQTLFPALPTLDEEKLIKCYKGHYVEDCQVPAQLFSNTSSLLTKLQATNKIITIATGKGRNGLDKILIDTQTTDFFHATKCADEYTSKPHPHMVNALLEEFSIHANDAVMIGDSRHDMAMAQNAGVDRIGVTHGVNSGNELKFFKPVAVVDDIYELERLLLPL